MNSVIHKSVLEKIISVLPDEKNMTVAQGITAASMLNSVYTKSEITDKDKSCLEYRFDFDDPSVVVDLAKRNSRNTNGINFARAEGRIENSCLVVKPTVSPDGIINAQAVMNGLDLAARYYDKISIRIKRENISGEETLGFDESVCVYYKTSTNSSYSQDKCVSKIVSGIAESSEWFDVEIEAGENPTWKDYITSLRLDMPKMIGLYSVDYLVLTKSEKIETDGFYKYFDYAVEKGIVTKDRFSTQSFYRDITKAEFCDLIASSLSEESFKPINEVYGIRGYNRDSKNADIYLALYRAGVLDGDFCEKSSLSKSDAEKIITRAALADYRVTVKTDVDWRIDSDNYDLEFEDCGDDEKFTVRADSTEIMNGSLLINCCEEGEKILPVNTPEITYRNVQLSARDYVKLKVRMKAEFKGHPQNTSMGLYFMREGDESFSDKCYMSTDLVKCGYIDPFGWYVAEIDFGVYSEWKGTITGLRFDPVYANGTFVIDYVRLIKTDPLYNASHEKLMSLGYKSNGMLQDNNFEKGFHVQHFEQHKISRDERIWQYNECSEKPLWDIGPWWNLYDLWEHRDMTADKYTLTDDKGINTVKYCSNENYLSMRVNATKIYNGEPHDVNTYKWWPHLLLNQAYTKYPVPDKKKNSAAADRVFLELDMRVSDFKDTINKEGANSCAFLLYFYFITDKAPAEKIWYGFHLFNDYAATTDIVPVWAPDSAAHQYMYGLMQASVFDGIENSFIPSPGNFVVGSEWKHIRVDVTEHIERCIDLANRDKAFGLSVTRDDMYFGGCNIGFEIHGNYDITVDFKNLDMIAYYR